jgi:hypothetical protein
MKKLIFISFSILIISFLASCDKEDTQVPTKATVSGKVLALNTKNPVKGAKVLLYKSIFSGGLGGSSITVVLDTVFTNDKGEYTFSYDYTLKSEFFVRAYANNYYTSSNARYDIWTKKENIDIPLTPYAWITLRVLNVPPIGNNDDISIRNEWEQQNEQFYKSGSCDTIFTKKIYGNQKTKLYVSSQTNGGSKIQNYIDSLYCKGLDTTYYTITY